MTNAAVNIESAVYNKLFEFESSSEKTAAQRPGKTIGGMAKRIKQYKHRIKAATKSLDKISKIPLMELSELERIESEEMKENDGTAGQDDIEEGQKDAEADKDAEAEGQKNVEREEGQKSMLDYPMKVRPDSHRLLPKKDDPPAKRRKQSSLLDF